MNKNTHHIYNIVLLLLLGAALPLYAQTINGNVFGGGNMSSVEGSANVTINGGSFGADIFGGGNGSLNNDGTISMSANVSGNTSVTINGGKFVVSCDDKSTAKVTFKEHYNIYGGGNIASQVGETHVYVTKGMFAKDSDGKGIFLENSNTKGIAQAYYQEGQMYFCVFGGGYGKNTSVTGDTWLDFHITGMTDINSTVIEDDLLEYQSYLDVVGGGFNGTVKGNSHVHMGGNAMCRNVYGGGLYAAVGTKDDAETGKTNVYITGGNIDNVYGGGVMSDILTSSNVNIGLHDALSFDGRDYAVDNEKITILMSVFGSNGVSGRVETANINHYGGTVNKNIYGAGNGDYKGYYTPNLCDYADGENDNYYMVDHSGDKDYKGNPSPSGPTYKGRPQTGNVNLTLAGKSKEDRAIVLGQVFGGGNSCTIGDWDENLLNTTYSGNPHLVRDDPDYFLGRGMLNVNLGSHVTIGRTHKVLETADDRDEYIDNGENVSGLFMGCSGKSLATESGDKSEDNHYHHFYKGGTYYPGFAVAKEDGATLSREEQLKPFQAYLNNIMVRSDEVHLNFAEGAEDIWLANFVGGGFRGSMRAKTEYGKFDYTLPEGVTVSHTIVGGAYNAHVQYRMFESDSDGNFVDKDSDGNWDYATEVPDYWIEGKDYIKKLYEDEEHPEKVTGILRYNFNGGILSDNSTGVSTSDVGHRIHNVHLDPREDGITDDERDARYATAYFEPMDEDSDDPNKEDAATRKKLFTANRDKVLLHLDIRCALEPEVFDKANGTGYRAHGGNVFGGCFMSGFVEGDSWIDYNCWLSPKCSNSKDPGDVYFFNKKDNMHIYGEVADLETNNALSVYGAGYGADTHSDGDVYLYIKSITHTVTGDTDPTGMFPYIYNAFGGSNMGTVAGNTNVYYAVGQQGTLLGSLYGGSYKGVIEGNTFVEMAEGFANNVYGGSRQADIHGASHVWAYDGKFRGIKDANHLIICNLYGGNDIAGTISGTMPAKFTESKWNAAPNGDDKPRPNLTDKKFNTYVEISADDGSANRGFPLIGSAYAGGNGEAWVSEQLSGPKPEVETTLLEIEGGSTLRAFGGGNMATVTGNTYIFTNAASNNFANVTFTDYQKNIMTKVFFNSMKSGYRWDDNTLTIDPYHVVRLFGGNNLATMDIQPTWNLWNGKIENVYSGGNMGDMTYYNPDGVMARKDGVKTGVLGVENADGTNVNLNPKGLNITVDSPIIRIGLLFGGCRMSNVTPTPKAAQPAWPEGDDGVDCYGATVNVIDGNIGYIFGGNDVSGTVEHGTNINICGGVIGQVYGSGNGDFLYKYIPADAGDDDLYADDEKSDTRITEHNSDEYGIYYTVPENDKDGNPIDDSSTGDTHKIMTINRIRPSVDNAFINISGLAPEYNSGNKGITLIKGNVYMGGNATTITRGKEEAFTKFKYGSYAVAGGLYMGSDGQDYTRDETISQFAKLNGIEDMGASTSFTAGHEDDASHNPILLNAYLTAVDMNALPKEFAIPSTGLTETYVGTICGGGNRGSMLVDKTIDLVIPQQITIFDKIVAGCNNATIDYNQNGTIIKSIGGYTRPLDIANNGTNGNIKIRYNIAAQFIPLKLDVPMGDNLKVPVNRTDHNEGEETYFEAIGHAFLVPLVNDAGNAYTTGCNIYGGCYSSGEIEGDVVLNIHSNMLRYANEEKLKNAIANDEACFNVFGAGFGQDSHVWGNVHIKMDKSDNVRLSQPEYAPIGSELFDSHYLDGQNQMTTYDTPSVNNIFGGGRNGKLIGNTTIEIRNGRVYSDVAGGCFASDMYGSSHIIVGYPTYYKCNTSGEYALQRGDQWNEDKGTIKQSVKYLKGDLVPQNVYEQITDASKDTKFESVNDVPDNWSKVDIKIGKGIYGGGYSLANSTSASAGSVTMHKLKATPANSETLLTLHPLNFDDRYGLEDDFNTEGYGGNSAVMVGDQAGEGTIDHISISTLIVKEATIPAGHSVIGKFVREDGKYTHQGDGPAVGGVTYYDLTGDGGIYGDGHLTFSEGFRAADITGYGYNTGTVKFPRLMNTFQRLDLLNLNDCCVMLQGAQDFATNQIDATIYSMTRIDELRMNSSLDPDATLGQISAATGPYPGDQFDVAKQRNYLGLFNNIHYLGSIVTNDDFATGPFHGADGQVGTNDYKKEKLSYITAYSGSSKDVTETEQFKKRNLGTARNAIGINNGFCLRVESLDLNGDHYYGPIVGVAEVKLLTLTQGEGGGYVYADNIHEDKDNFLNTSGNFVFPGVVAQGLDANGEPIADQYIVDDCFAKHYGKPGDITTRDMSHPLDEVHYWYVEGSKYFFNTTLTGYTFQDPITFDLITNDPHIVLSGIEDKSQLNVKKIEWLSTHRYGYECVLENNTEDKVDDYEFDLEVNGSTWTTDMPRYTKGMDPEPLTSGKIYENPAPIGRVFLNTGTPIFNVKLQDKLNNSGNDNYINHLDEPELVKIYLEGVTNGQTYNYTITMRIVYLQGPSYEGGVSILNCALPGERIGFTSGGIKIKTPELMPVTATAWEILPFKEIDGDGVWKWDNDRGVKIPESQYSEDLTGNLTGWIPALYKQNESTIAYIFTAGGHHFPVMPKQDAALKQNRMIVVHNYHRMKDIVEQSIEESVSEGACVYISNLQDFTKFVEWVNADKLTTGVDFILQGDIKLTSPLTITRPFDGTFHGDGYHIDLNGNGSSLFGDNLTGKVYNLGLVGGTIASTGTVENSYELKDSKDLSDPKILYGSKAYALSHHFIPTASGYVEGRYANGDYQYATTDRVWSLRTGEPWYGHEETRHDWEHTHDEARWNETDKVNVPLYSGTGVVADKTVDISGNGTEFFIYKGIPAEYANDYLFFGQHLDKENADAYPMHIHQVATGDEDEANGGNRVYETAGYYQSKNDQKFYYNKDAWALDPALTAIDYTNMTTEGDTDLDDDGVPDCIMPTKFSVDSNKDNSDGSPTYSNANYGHVTQNLLVYNAGETLFDQNDVDSIAEKDVMYHNIKNGKTDYFHLVDKQDFNAPIAFNVGKVWYERKPQNYRSGSTMAWEGICIPFTANKVYSMVDIPKGGAPMESVISHFYGEELTCEPNENDHTLHHEYWLNGMVAATSGVAFARPSKTGTGLFTNDYASQEGGNYEFKNDYFVKLPHYDDYYGTRDDDVYGDDNDKAWYATSHTFTDYVYLSHAVPYVVAFPGEDYYEFALTNPVVFENSETTIKVSDDEKQSSVVGAYTHNGTYIHRTAADYVIDADGNGFENTAGTVTTLPFRTYITNSSSSARVRYIPIDTDDQDEYDNDMDKGTTDRFFKIYSSNNRLFIEANFSGDLNIYSPSGQYIRKVHVESGLNQYDDIHRGVYVVGGKKVAI